MARNRRTPGGGTTEDWTQTLVRLAQAGVYPNADRSFAYDKGRHGARLVAMDFLTQRPLLAFLDGNPNSTFRIGLTQR